MQSARGPQSAVAGLVAVAAALALTACSAGDAGSGKPGPSTVAALKVCEQAFGAEGVTTARATLGTSGLEAEGTSWDTVRQSMLKEARAYVPGEEDMTRGRHEPCRMSTSGESVKRVEARVQWSLITMDHVTVDDTKRAWRKAADDVYVQWVSRLPALAAVLPCRVPGTATGQDRALPLEVRVETAGLGADRETLTGTLLASLVRETHERLGCENPLTVPASLLPR
ncbi:hypothetical protein ACIRQY_30175 [Streptomyces sp. NPDC101490]|uniref:hypothetical protein n=1 Tax=unclassified Streptomyces TaxID=2593676 RepID=UPI0033208BBD